MDSAVTFCVCTPRLHYEPQGTRSTHRIPCAGLDFSVQAIWLVSLQGPSSFLRHTRCHHQVQQECVQGIKGPPCAPLMLACSFVLVLCVPARVPTFRSPYGGGVTPWHGLPRCLHYIIQQYQPVILLPWPIFQLTSSPQPRTSAWFSVW